MLADVDVGVKNEKQTRELGGKASYLLRAFLKTVSRRAHLVAGTKLNLTSVPLFVEKSQLSSALADMTIRDASLS